MYLSFISLMKEDSFFVSPFLLSLSGGNLFNVVIFGYALV